jgi:hypothetical protein
MKNFDLGSIFIIFVTFAILIIFYRIFRFFYYFIRCFYLSKKYQHKYDKETTKILTGKLNKPDEIKERNKEAELKLKRDLKKLSKKTDLTVKTDRVIVGIAKPVGIWTKFVTQQKISWLKAMVGSKAESDKFWQNIIKAQEQAKGKQKSRTR